MSPFNSFLLQIRLKLEKVRCARYSYVAFRGFGSFHHFVMATHSLFDSIFLTPVLIAKCKVRSSDWDMSSAYTYPSGS